MKFTATNGKNETVSAEWIGACWWGVSAFSDNEDIDADALIAIHDAMTAGELAGVVTVEGADWHWVAG